MRNPKLLHLATFNLIVSMRKIPVMMVFFLLSLQVKDLTRRNLLSNRKLRNLKMRFLHSLGGGKSFFNQISIKQIAKYKENIEIRRIPNS